MMDMKNQLKIAAIMDEFTFKCYAPECELLQLSPDNFINEINEFKPDFLFIESAWRGKDELWSHKLYKNMDELVSLTGYCRDKGIPIVFWSKEDPVHFSIFIKTAALADYVFTTDADCIELYKGYLGHNEVYYLPFAAQPLLHNPIEEYKREDKFCFAGSFYSRYKERSAAFLALFPIFQKYGLDIYDRNFYKEMEGYSLEYYSYPPQLLTCVRGFLPYNEISRAYKGYRYGINMTSMMQSGFMFARRVFELLACNTVTVSNYSRGMDILFGNLLIATNDKDYMEKQLESFQDNTAYRKYRLAGLRHVLANHLYEDRLDRVAKKVLGYSIKKALPKILVVSFASGIKEKEHVMVMFKNQSYSEKQIVFADETVIYDINFDFLTLFSQYDYYGKNYLLDFALATRFSAVKLIGKGAFYSNGELLHENKTYTIMEESVCLNRQMAAKNIFNNSLKLSDLENFNLTEKILYLDEFNYCENALECSLCEDVEVSTGSPIHSIYTFTDNIKPVKIRDKVHVPLEELYNETIISKEDKVKKALNNGTYTLIREEDDNVIVWLRTGKNYSVSDFATGSKIGFRTETVEKRGNVRCQIEYYDEAGTKLDFLNFALDGFHLLRISDNAKTFKLIFRLEGKASVGIKEFYAVSPDSLVAAPFVTKDTILITESYTNYGCTSTSLIGLHKYTKEKELEVIKISDKPNYLPFNEIEGVRVISVLYDALAEYLKHNPIECAYLYKPSNRVMDFLDDKKIKISVIKEQDLCL
jgi:spore maturation protein CgeB